jgi:superfamily II DNA or RNA helicase
MITLTRSNSYFFINSDITLELRDSLDEVLSYYKEGYEKTDAFQSGRWDGKDHLLRRASNGSYYFPFGLLDKVCQVFRIWGLKYEIVDDVCPIKPIPDGYGDDESIRLRPYQRDALNKLILNCYNSSGIIALPTAAGKTILSLFYARYIGLPFMVLVHRVELLRQWRDEIKDKLGIDATLIGAGEDRAGDGRATIAMVQTLAKRDVGYKTGLLICDELHILSAATFYPVAMKINAKYRLGLSATPTRADGAELKIFACCGCIASVVSVEDLVKDGYLAVPEFHMVQLPTCRVPYSSTWQTVYKQGIVLNMDRNEKIADIARGYLKEGRQVYVHVNRVDHGKILEGMIEGAVFVHGATKKDEREEIIARFKSGEIRCLISTLLKEGVSIDGISCLILASAGRSFTAVIQVIGRALRVDPEFGSAVIVDFIDRGHRMLENHVQERIMAYRKTYGSLYTY